MQYLLLIYAQEETFDDLLAQDGGAVLDRYRQVTRELQASGAWVSGDRLERVDTATTVRVRDGKRTTTDGPFAETTEQLGGYFLIEAPDLDAAIAWAEKLPASEYGCVEVRPIMVVS